MYIPLWFIVAATVLAAGFLAVSICAHVKARRHHDHLFPSQPRRPRR